jgi:hypothetical protein
VAIDDCARLAYAEVLPDETKEVTARFLDRALRHFARRGIPITRLLTDYGSALSLRRVCRRPRQAWGAAPPHAAVYPPGIHGQTPGRSSRHCQQTS